METGHEFMDTHNNEDSGNRQNTNMKINFDYHEQQAKMTKSGYSFKSKIKSQYELDKSSSQHESQILGKRAKSMAGTRRPKKQLSTFDIQVRSFNYKAVPDISEVQMQKNHGCYDKKSQRQGNSPKANLWMLYIQVPKCKSLELRERLALAGSHSTGWKLQQLSALT